MKLESKIRSDLRRMNHNPCALSRLIGIKRQVLEITHNGNLTDSPVFEEIAELVKDVPAGVDCFCCGFKNLRRFHRRDGKIIGPECIHHTLGGCKKR